MNCPFCKQTNREGAIFCQKCGEKLPTPQPIAEEVPAEAEAPATAEQTAEAPPTIEEPPAPPERDVEEEEPAPTEEPAKEEVAPPTLEPEEPPVETEDKPIEAAAEGEQEGEEEILTPWRKKKELLPAVDLGTVLDGRYVVREVLEMNEEGTTYLAGDLKKCRQCGAEDNAPDDAFCSRCGAELRLKPGCRLQERPFDPEEEKQQEGDRPWFVENGRLYVVLPEDEGAPKEIPSAKIPINTRLIIGQRSASGLVRELDEDSLLTITLISTFETETQPALGLFAVADGMGGHEGGEVASKLALQILARHVLKNIFLPESIGEQCLAETISECLKEGVQAANEAVHLNRRRRGTNMGTTLTVALFKNGQIYISHVGDCRAYHWGEEGLRHLTEDHSLVAKLVAAGHIKPEEIYTHPQRSVIYRSIGDKPVVEVDTIQVALAPGERLLLCSDGLWEMVRDRGIEEVMLSEPDPQTACDTLVKQANMAGGEDNISVIVVQVEEV